MTARLQERTTRTERPSGEGTLARRARDAPARPGVYLLFGDERRLLYIGKATNLRRRLLDHAAGRGGRSQRVLHRVHEVSWIECADERAALCKEADLIVALAPPLNAVMADDAYTYVCVHPIASRGPDRVRFRLIEDPNTAPGRVYGAFPHLGKGKSSWRAVRTNAGYSAFLRLIWVAFAERDVRFRIPSQLRGTSPPMSQDCVVDGTARAMLHNFLSGRSRRLLGVLRDSVRADDVPAFMRRALADDVIAAEEFYLLGPHALRRLRRVHGLRPQTIDQETFARVIADGLRSDIGAFETAERPKGSVRRIPRVR